MITVAAAQEIIWNTTRDWGAESVSIHDCLGRVLAEPIMADRDMPPFDRVTMDGIAIRYQSWKNGIRKFKIETIAPAGAPQVKLENTDSCIEVMTGTILPEGCDTVIRYEDLKISERDAVIVLEELRRGINIHTRGTDRKEKDIIVPKGKKINAGITNILASTGKNKVAVARLPKSIIISTGDELIPIGQKPLPHQVRRSNVHMLLATLKNLYILAEEMHIPDNEETIKRELKNVIEKYELIILSGGVSMGKFDFIPNVLKELGVQESFHKVQQRPGKPLWFGTIDGGPVVFGLPGNPVSSLACACRYIVPWIKKCIGYQEGLLPLAILGEDIHFLKPLTYFLQVKLQDLDGKLIAFPAEGNGSGDLANLGITDAFIELPKERSQFFKGEKYAVYPF